mmetsp:Transcript_61806/g.201664  ORF Transcript_61806/g.201664 Transcript_61806/m.201664 type:complete len:258 (+) Transcript_61806:144-917(+)
MDPGLLALFESKPFAIVIDAASADLDVVLRSRAWLALTSGKETTLLQQLGDEAFQRFSFWLDMFLLQDKSKPRVLPTNGALFQKMTLKAQDNVHYKAALMVYLPAASSSMVHGSHKPVLVAIEKMKAIRKPRQRGSTLGTITEQRGEEDAAAQHERKEALFDSARSNLLQIFEGLDPDASSSTVSSASDSASSSGSSHSSSSSGRPDRRRRGSSSDPAPGPFVSAVPRLPLASRPAAREPVDEAPVRSHTGRIIMSL